MLLRELAIPSRARVSRSAATGSRSAQARGGGGPSVRGARTGRSASGSSRARASGATQRSAYRCGAAAVEALGGQQVGAGGRVGHGGRHDRAVADDPARATRRASGRARRASSQSSRTAPSSRRPRTLCSPEVRRHGSVADDRREAAQRVELLARPLVLARLAQLARRAPRAARSAPRRRARRTRATGSGSGRVDQSAAECSFFIRYAEQRLDQRGQADPRVAEQAAGQLGVEQRRRREADLVAGRAGPGWRRAGSTRCRPGPPAASSREVEADRVDQEACRRPRGAAGSGRRARSSGSRRPARRRWRPARCRRQRLARLGERGRGVGERRAGRRAARAGAPAAPPAPRRRYVVRGVGCRRPAVVGGRVRVAGVVRVGVMSRQ